MIFDVSLLQASVVGEFLNLTLPANHEACIAKCVSLSEPPNKSVREGKVHNNGCSSK
jgi:hypothetical protein